jgi:hypothetical protein
MEERERNLNKQQPQEDPAEPEGLEVEPQESEDS